MVSTKTDDDLLLHLIATHHGSARPFAEPVVENGAAKAPFIGRLFDMEYALDSAAREVPFGMPTCRNDFGASCVSMAGGTTYREAILRLADHAQSREEQDTDGKPHEQGNGRVPPFPSYTSARCLHDLPLSGLDGANPLAFLAALGTLRLANEAFPGTLLGWQRLCGWNPVLKLPRAVSIDEFTKELYPAFTFRLMRRPGKLLTPSTGSIGGRKRMLKKPWSSSRLASCEGRIAMQRRSGSEPPARSRVGRPPSMARCARVRSTTTIPIAWEIDCGYGRGIREFLRRAAERLHDHGARERFVADFVSAF